MDGGISYRNSMLNGIHLVDFGNHRNTRLTFGPMSALVGQNGSGKTTVMRAVQEVKCAMLLQNDWSMKRGLRRKGGYDTTIAVGWDLGHSQRGGAKLADHAEWFTFKPFEPEELVAWIPSPMLSLRLPGLEDFLDRPSSPTESITNEGEVSRRHDPAGFWSCRYFKTSASSLQRPAVANPSETVLNSDGSNLAWALSSLMTEHPDRFQLIVEALREVVPIVQGIRSKAVSLKQLVKQTITINKRERTFDEERNVNGQELIFDMKSGKGLPATSVSEGTLVVLAVLTLVYGSDADLIMLDDVELGLHPKAQRDLIRQLRRIQETHPKLQILVSTHSPYVIDEFKAEDVWVFAPDKEGCAVSKRLSEHPDAKRALEVLTTGEFWSAEGEPWVLDEEPTARVAEEPGA